MNSIKKHREAAGMSQEQLAAKVNVHQTAVSQWENGETFPRANTLKILSRIFDCTRTS